MAGTTRGGQRGARAERVRIRGEGRGGQVHLQQELGMRKERMGRIRRMGRIALLCTYI